MAAPRAPPAPRSSAGRMGPPDCRGIRAALLPGGLPALVVGVQTSFNHCRAATGASLKSVHSPGRSRRPCVSPRAATPTNSSSPARAARALRPHGITARPPDRREEWVRRPWACIDPGGKGGQAGTAVRDGMCTRINCRCCGGHCQHSYRWCRERRRLLLPPHLWRAAAGGVPARRPARAGGTFDGTAAPAHKRHRLACHTILLTNSAHFMPQWRAPCCCAPCCWPGLRGLGQPDSSHRREQQ